jgi:GNAT superfamily N-acetyltransferase
MDEQIRKVAASDAEAVAKLSAELGYPVSISTMEERIQSASASSDRATYVSCINSAVVGWIDVFEVLHLQSGASAEIGGLVVSSQYRSAGIGARLVRRAEQWARERGLARVIVRSRSTREAAHRFYLREGYAQTKTSAVFSKFLQSPHPPE